MTVFRSYLQLMRFPAVFTALADIFLGFVLVNPNVSPSNAADWSGKLAILLFASAMLYLSGMILNDVFDVEVDRRERPERPLPSGRIPLPSAWLTAGAMILLGVAAAAIVGQASVVTAVAIVAAVFAYDGWLKDSLLGPVAMGLCRTLNIMLGASVAGSFWPDPNVVIIATGMGGYVMGVTWYARCEAVSGPRWPMFVGLLVVNASLFALVGFLFAGGTADGVSPNQIAFLIAIILVVINRRMVNGIQSGEPKVMQATVRTMLLSIITLDAALALAVTANAPIAIAIMLLLFPAKTVGRFIYVT